MSHTEDPKQCRICLDEGNANQLISPCFCTGTLAYVHRRCLNRWRSENINGRGFDYCDICHFRFVIQTVFDDPREERKRLLKYYLYIFRDVTLVMIPIQFIVLTLTLYLRILDPDGAIVEVFYKSPSVFLGRYLIAWTIFLAIVGFIGFIAYLCAPNDTGNNYSFTLNLGTRRSTRDKNDSSDDKKEKEKSKSKNRFLDVLVGLVFLFAVLGVFIGIIKAVKFVKHVSQKHTEKLWLRQEADKYFVKDFHGRRDELDQYQTN